MYETTVTMVSSTTSASETFRVHTHFFLDPSQKAYPRQLVQQFFYVPVKLRKKLYKINECIIKIGWINFRF